MEILNIDWYMAIMVAGLLFEWYPTVEDAPREVGGRHLQRFK